MTTDTLPGIGKLTNAAFARIAGLALRSAREAAGLTRLQVVARLPSGIGDRALLTYEHGIRHITLTRFVEICVFGIGCDPLEILRTAVQQTRDLRGYTMTVNLQLVSQDTREHFEPVQAWAARRLEDHGHPDLVLAPPVVREMAAVLGYTHTDLATYLVEASSKTDPEKSA